MTVEIETARARFMELHAAWRKADQHRDSLEGLVMGAYAKCATGVGAGPSQHDIREWDLAKRIATQAGIALDSLLLDRFGN